VQVEGRRVLDLILPPLVLGVATGEFLADCRVGAGPEALEVVGDLDGGMARVLA